MPPRPNRTNWRELYGEELRAFVRGKVILDMEYGWGGRMTTVFTDGSAIRCEAEDGTVYSTNSADSALVKWEVSDSET